MHARSASSQPAPRSPAAAVGPHCSTYRPLDSGMPSLSRHQVFSSLGSKSSGFRIQTSDSNTSLGHTEIWLSRCETSTIDHIVRHSREHLMGLRKASRPHVTLRSSKMRRNAPGLCLTQRRVDAYNNRLFVIDNMDRPIARPIAWMNAARTPSWSCLPPCAEPAVKRLRRQPMPR